MTQGEAVREHLEKDVREAKSGKAASGKEDEGSAHLHKLTSSSLEKHPKGNRLITSLLQPG